MTTPDMPPPPIAAALLRVRLAERAFEKAQARREDAFLAYRALPVQDSNLQARHDAHRRWAAADDAKQTTENRLNEAEGVLTLTVARYYAHLSDNALYEAAGKDATP